MLAQHGNGSFKGNHTASEAVLVASIYRNEAFAIIPAFIQDGCADNPFEIVHARTRFGGKA